MPKKTLLQICICICLAFSLQAQNTRTYDGSLNNLSHPKWGATNTQLLRVTSIGYSDGVSEPGGLDRPNPRILSNDLFGQNGIISDPLNMSDFAWAFGQFIDHDIDFTSDQKNEPYPVKVPAGDIYFDPQNKGKAVVPMFRSKYDPKTGTNVNNPRQQLNFITSWIDASTIYGSDLDRARWLRTFEGGKLRTSDGNLLPFNTKNGQFNSPHDRRAPEMDNANPFIEKLFVAGDVRANEQPLLIAFHTLFLREHNRLCEEVRAASPSLSDEEIFQHARRIVIGLIQKITFEEWLPAMGVKLPTYTGYNPNVNPSIMNVFSAAAFRLGHTLVNANIIRLDMEGDTISQGSIGLKEAFFNPLVVISGGGIDPIFKGMATQVQQKLDCKMVDDLRNFLFGPPGAGGLDLAAININRGRERGLPDFNTVRTNFGLARATNFSDITVDPEMINGLKQAYGSIDKIDPWVGMLAEDHMNKALFGETIMFIMKRQFSALRDGDRFYYEIDPGLSQKEIENIKQTRLVDIIRRNTNIDLMQENVFYAMPHDMIVETKLELEENHLEMVVYPNPVENEFNLAVFSEVESEGQLQMIDILGRVLMDQKVSLTQGLNTFPMNLDQNYTKGVYNIILKVNKKVGRQKILKN